MKVLVREFVISISDMAPGYKAFYNEFDSEIRGQAPGAVRIFYDSDLDEWDALPSLTIGNEPPDKVSLGDEVEIGWDSVCVSGAVTSVLSSYKDAGSVLSIGIQHAAVDVHEIDDFSIAPEYCFMQFKEISQDGGVWYSWREFLAAVAVMRATRILYEDSVKAAFDLMMKVREFIKRERKAVMEK